MIVLPYLSAENLAKLERSGVSGIDLCGNGLVTIPGEIFVTRTGQPNRFPRSEPIRNVYRGDSSLVARVFLSKSAYGTVGEIVKTVKEKGGSVSFATVSKVLKTLEADLIVARSSEEIKLVQADKLLDQLAENYREPKTASRWIGKVELADERLIRSLAVAARSIGARAILTGAGSAMKYSVLAREPIVAAYCTATPKAILAAVGAKFEETDRFPNVDLTVTTEQGPYFDSNVQNGDEYASPVQTYLELRSGDKRQRETAEQVRDYILRRIGMQRSP